MNSRFGLAVIALVGSAICASAAQAECKGTNGRGWSSGKGQGEFEMTAKDKSCKISYVGFIFEAEKKRIQATEVALTKAPRNGTVSIVPGKGLLYTPAAGFKGKDRFCTKNTSPEVKGQSLRGCITVTVR